ncbi:MAG: 30S ribosome-binding factor RbfA [Anaerolineae bacterium]|nr:30S ribosome-binding factor RbfA [Anaerolineae bacterium]
MASRRQHKVAELLHEEISQLIQYDAQDPRLGFVTVTGVEVSPDLRQARVYFTTLDDTAVAETLAGLASASGYFRRQLAQSLSLRYVPELTFKLDTSLEYGLHIDRLLDAIQEEERETSEDEASEDEASEDEASEDEASEDRASENSFNEAGAKE